jgi:hypothetical protein
LRRRCVPAALVACAAGAALFFASPARSQSGVVRSPTPTIAPTTTTARRACPARCQVRRLAAQTRRVWAGAVLVAAHAFIDPPAPRPRRVRTLASALREYRTYLLYARRVERLARRPLAARIPHYQQWMCIHRYEGGWREVDANTYFGGLQMDRPFMQAYGADMLRRHHHQAADRWLPAEQLIVANRAWRLRGYAPWPNTARICGLR